MKVIIKGPQKPPVDTGVFNILTVAGSKKNRDDFKSITMETTTFNDDLLKRIKKLGKVHEAVLTAVIRPSKKNQGEFSWSSKKNSRCAFNIGIN